MSIDTNRVRQVSDAGVTAEIRTCDRDVYLRFSVTDRQMSAGARRRLTDAVLATPEVQAARSVHVAAPLGECEIMLRLQRCWPQSRIRAAGATTLLDSEVGAR